MRAVLGIVSLLLVLAGVGLLVRKQLASTRSAVPVLVQPAAGATPPASVRSQSQQVQQQYQQAVERLMQPPRALPDAAQ